MDPLNLSDGIFRQFGHTPDMDSRCAHRPARPTQSDTETYYGRLRKAREFSRRATESARKNNAKETAALWQAYTALHEAKFRLGSSSGGFTGGRDKNNINKMLLMFIPN